MKIIGNHEKKEIILADGDQIEVKTLKGNPLTICISCIEGCLYIDEILAKKIKDMEIEEEQTKVLIQYNQRKKQEKSE